MDAVLDALRLALTALPGLLVVGGMLAWEAAGFDVVTGG